MQLTARLKIPYPDLNGDDTPVDIPQVWFNRAVILDGLAPITEGPLSGRPVSTSGAPGIAGRFYVTTDQVDSPRLDLDTGTAWVTVGPARVDAAANIASLRTLGTGAQQAAAGNDARLIGGGNASGDITGTYPGPLTVATWGGLTKSQVVAGNTPQAHAGSHAPAGSDAISGLTDASIAATNKDGAAGLASMRTLGAGAQQAMAGNATPTPAAHATTHKYGGTDPLVSLKPTPQNANYSAVAGDLVLMTGSNNTVTLPNAPSVDGAQCAVMAISANVTVNRAGTDTITTTAQGQLTVAVAQGTTVVFTYHSGVWYGIVSGGSGGGASGLVPLNPPSRAVRNATLALPTGVATKIPVDAVSFDPTGSFDVTTNHRFVAQTAGYFLVEGGIQLTGASAAPGVTAMVFKNGAEISDGTYSAGTGQEIVDVLQLNAGDYVELYVWNGSGATVNLVANKPAGNYLTVAQIAQVGSPPAGQGLTTAVRAYRNAAFNIGTASAKIAMDSVSFDPGGNFSTANGRYICPATGYYSVVGSAGTIASSAGNAIVLNILKNGVQVSQSEIQFGGASYNVIAQVSDIVYCQAGDYLEIWANAGTAVTGSPNAYSTYMSVVQVAGSSIFGALSPTAQSAAYTAGAGQLVLMTGANAVTLPNAPIPGSQIEVLALTAAVPVNRSGTDTINNSGVAGLQSLTVQAGQSTIFSYLNGVWYASPVGGGQALAPPARAFKNGAQAIPVGTTKITLDTKTFDPGGNFDVTTNNRYIAPVSGYYAVEASVALTSTSDGQVCVAQIEKNTTTFVSIGSEAQASASGQNITSTVTDVIQLNAGDWIELTVNAGAALNLSASSALTYMAVHQVGVPVGAPSPGQGQATVARAYRNAALSVGSATVFKVPLDTISYDPGNNISVANGRYVCPATGYYQVDGWVAISTTGVGIQAQLFKNGAVYTTGNCDTVAIAGTGFSVSDIVYCQAGDYLELWCWTNGAATVAVGQPYETSFSVAQVAGTNLVGALSPTAQSADYTAGAGQSVLMTGAHTVTLPNSPMNGSVEEIVAENGNVTVNRSGTNTITQGATTGLLTLTVLSGKASTLRFLNGVWHVVSMVSLT